MRTHGSRRGQRGITLIVGMILLVLITLMVTTAFNLNTTNLKTVGNMQFRNEAVASAQRAVEFVVSNSFASGFLSVPADQSVAVDINNDTNADYTVTVYRPTCVQAVEIVGSGGSGACGGLRAGGLSGCGTTNYNTLWEIKATVTDSISGAQVTLTQGVRVEISESQKSAVCANPL